jgi:hypothetical protein
MRPSPTTARGYGTDTRGGWPGGGGDREARRRACFRAGLYTLKPEGDVVRAAGRGTRRADGSGRRVPGSGSPSFPPRSRGRGGVRRRAGVVAGFGLAWLA